MVAKNTSNIYTLVFLIAVSTLMSACTKDQDFGRIPNSDESASLSVSENPVVVIPDPCDNNACSGQPFTQNMTYYNGTNKLDLLFVVDNSGSMSNEQTTLSDSMSNFANAFATQSFDVQYGFTSTTRIPQTLTPDDQLAYNGIFSGTSVSSTVYYGYNVFGGNSIITPPGTLFSRFFNDLGGNEHFLASSSTNIASKLKANAKFGSVSVNQTSCEQSLSVVYDTLGSGNLSGVNSGFVRSDAHLGIIFLTDEDDCYTQASGETDADHLNTIKTRILSAKSGDSSKVHLAYIIDLLASDPGTYPATYATNQPYPKRMRQASQTAGLAGNKIDINQSFGTALTAEANNMVGAIQCEYRLDHNPLVSSIAVSLAGSPVPISTTNGWTYNATNISVKFTGTYCSSSHNGESISITYEGI